MHREKGILAEKLENAFLSVRNFYPGLQIFMRFLIQIYANSLFFYFARNRDSNS